MGTRASSTTDTDTLVLVNMRVRMDIPIKVYTRSGGRLELSRRTSFAEIADRFEHEKAMEAYRSNNLTAFKKIVTDVVRRWVEGQGSKVLAVAQTDEGIEFFVKASTT